MVWYIAFRKRSSWKDASKRPFNKNKTAISIEASLFHIRNRRLRLNTWLIEYTKYKDEEIE